MRKREKDRNEARSPAEHKLHEHDAEAPLADGSGSPRTNLPYETAWAVIQLHEARNKVDEEAILALGTRTPTIPGSAARSFTSQTDAATTEIKLATAASLRILPTHHSIMLQFETTHARTHTQTNFDIAPLFVHAVWGGRSKYCVGGNFRLYRDCYRCSEKVAGTISG
jgi:hypothetical protein